VQLPEQMRAPVANTAIEFMREAHLNPGQERKPAYAGPIFLSTKRHRLLQLPEHVARACSCRSHTVTQTAVAHFAQVADSPILRQLAAQPAQAWECLSLALSMGQLSDWVILSTQQKVHVEEAIKELTKRLGSRADANKPTSIVAAALVLVLPVVLGLDRLGAAKVRKAMSEGVSNRQTILNLHKLMDSKRPLDTLARYYGMAKRPAVEGKPPLAKKQRVAQSA
jgi:hypothetical protein